MNQQSGSGSSMGVGVSSILMIFVALCLTIFATLSFLSANADWKLSQKAADSVAAYYQADAEAERKFQQIAAAFSPDDPSGSLAGLDVTVSEEAGNTLIRYAVLIGGRRSLSVELQADASQPTGFQRRLWRVETEPGEQTDAGFHLMQAPPTP